MPKLDDVIKQLYDFRVKYGNVDVVDDDWPASKVELLLSPELIDDIPVCVLSLEVAMEDNDAP